MPRPPSWLPRLHTVHRTVANSPRSHYGRKDLELLFELGSRASQNLLELLPTLRIGTSHLVDREELLRFLDRVRDADDTTALFEQIRAEKTKASLRKPLTLVQRDIEPVSFASLPESVNLSRGRLEVNFRSTMQLAESLYAVARLLEADGDGFTRNFELEMPPPQAEDAEEVARMFAKLEEANN